MEKHSSNQKENKFITIDKRFEKSINLFFDLGNQEKVDSYINTPSSEKILNQYMEGLQPDSTDRVSMLIGPYGKGKSHLLLVLMDTLEKMDKPYLPVLISYGQQDLKHEFLLGLNKALKRAAIEDIKPQSYYTEALRQIGVWEKEYPETYEKLGDELKREMVQENECIAELVEGLHNQSKKALELFRTIYPKLTAGGVFEPLIQTDLKENFMSMNRQLVEKYGYAGMFIVFDEFGKYIEGHSKEGYENDMKVLQDMCELAAKSKEYQIHLTLVTHKSIKEYGNTVDKRILDGFMGIEGRIKEIFYVDSVQNYYEIIANVVKKDKKVFEKKIVNNKKLKFKKMLEENYNLPIFSSLFTKKEFEQTVGYGCYPLTPIGAYLLLQISQRVAQNERTIFTFLAGSEENGLENLVQQGKGESYLGARTIYDYFENTFREEVNNIEIHREWLKAEFALAQVADESERAFIKTLSIISMLHRDTEMPPTDTYIRLAMGLEQAEYENIRQSLLSQNLLLYRGRRGICQLKNNIGIDIDEELKQVSESIQVEGRIRPLLNQVWDIPYELPKRYNSEHKMTRFFTYEFMYPKDFYVYETFSYLFEETFSDGKIILLLEHGEDNKIKEVLTAAGDMRILVINPDVDFAEQEMLRTYEAVKQCRQDEEFVNHSKVIREELEWYEQDIHFELNSILEQNYLPENGKCSVSGLVLMGKESVQSSSVQPDNVQPDNVQSSSVQSDNVQSDNVQSSEKCLDNEKIDSRITGDTESVNAEVEELASVNKEVIQLASFNKEVEELAQLKDTTAQRMLSAKEYNRLLSVICELCYEKTPTVNHELINRNHVSSQIKKARKTLLEQILTRQDMGEYHKGTSAQASIYRAVFINSKGDRGIDEIQQMIRTFLKDACGKKNNLENLYEQLLKKPYGVRKGIIPLYLAGELVKLQDMPVLYCGNHEVPINAEILENIEGKPEEYEIYLEEATIEKEVYIQKLCELFGVKINDSKSVVSGSGSDENMTDRNKLSEKMTGKTWENIQNSSERNIHNSIEQPVGESVTNEQIGQLITQMLSWYRALPGFTRSYKNGLSREQLAFRNLLKGQDKNSRDMLFEDIPKLYKTQDYPRIIKKIKKTKQLLDTHMDNVYEEMAAVTRSVFGAAETDDMYNILKSWRRKNDRAIQSRICSTTLTQLVRFAERISGYEDRVALSEMSKIVIDVYPENWSESSLALFTKNLQDVLDELKAFELEAGVEFGAEFGTELGVGVGTRVGTGFGVGVGTGVGTEFGVGVGTGVGTEFGTGLGTEFQKNGEIGFETNGVMKSKASGKKLQFVGSDGQIIEKYYNQPSEEGTEVFLENAIDDAFEEFGDAIDNAGKVAILVKMLEKVIKGD